MRAEAAGADRSGDGTVDMALADAYRATDYHVDAAPPVVLRIGRREAAADRLLAAHGVATAAFLTAWNPASRTTPPAENDAAQARLRADLAAGGYATLPGRGLGRDGLWPPEESVLALGIDRSTAIRLARAYGQNAFVWLARQAAPELVWTGA